MPHKKKYYPEQVLIEKFQRGDISWLGYVKHHSPEWSKEYDEYCKKEGCEQNDTTAHNFIEFKDKQIEEGM